MHQPESMSVYLSGSADSICCGCLTRGAFGAKGEARNGENAPCGVRKKTADGPLPSPANAAPPARPGRCPPGLRIRPRLDQSGSGLSSPHSIADVGYVMPRQLFQCQGRRTGCTGLDDLLWRLSKNRVELPSVLDWPDTPFHTNGAERDICAWATRHGKSRSEPAAGTGRSPAIPAPEP